MSIYIAFDGPLDQYFMRYPDKLFGRPIENAMVDSRNATLVEQHLTCAAAEAPVIFQDDRRWFGDNVQDICIGLMNAGQPAAPSGPPPRPPFTPHQTRLSAVTATLCRSCQMRSLINSTCSGLQELSKPRLAT